MDGGRGWRAATCVGEMLRTDAAGVGDKARVVRAGVTCPCLSLRSSPSRPLIMA